MHLVPRRHSALTRLFGSETGDQTDKFARCAGGRDRTGFRFWMTRRGGSSASTDRFDVGDHVGFLLEPVAGHAPDKFEQLVTFTDVRDLEPGHEA